MSDEGSDDSAPRPKRKIKRVVVMSSSSGSDSDENIVVAGTRRKRLRVVSDAECDSSGSSVICAGTRRKRTLPKLRDSENDSDSSGWATDHSDVPKPEPSACKPASGFASDSSEGNSDKCSICLMRFTNQEVGTPQNCEHIFCLDCITEWSKNVNTCPVDRITFDSIVVRVCAGGRVLRTDHVKVVERRPSVEMLVVEDPTVCEICGSAENEESMLLCDGCDLGFHMQCLTPPLTEIPADQWFCQNCDILDMIHLSEVDDLFSSLVDLDLPIGPRQVALRQVRDLRRSRRSARNRLDEPSTSSGRRGGAADAEPSTSQGRPHSRRQNTATMARRRTTTAPRRKNKRRRTKTVLIEYEVEQNGKFPITKTVKRKVKKRRVKKRQPRTAARRTQVRQSVRAKLAKLKSDQHPETAHTTGVVQELSVRRQHAGIPSLSLFGDRYQLDYFSEEEGGASEGATTAVAIRPTSSVISSLRQARRKMIGIPSPPQASSAPDVLSSILESQTLLHSKNSIVEISVDGNVNIKLQKRDKPLKRDEPERVDLSKGEDTSKKAPSYPGQSRGGGWGGGYRGNYHREHGTGGFHRASYGDAGPPQRPPYPSNGARRDDDNYAAYGRRSYPPDEPYDRRAPRRPWPPPPGHPRPRLYDDPLDMRVGAPAPAPHLAPAPHQPPDDKPYRPLPEPPAFNFDKTPEVDRSEDERSDPGLVIDTEKYDPTEPTNDDDSDGPEPPDPAPVLAPPLRSPPAPFTFPPEVPVADITNVSAEVLDSAVRQVLREHQGLLAPAAAGSDDDSDGDCPNFSIYSATSVHIASEGAAPPPAQPPMPPPPRDDLADLVQEDDDPPEPEPEIAITKPLENKIEQEFKEKLSKRCPITTNPRNPIKIKLNTISLIKRQVSLYDDDGPDDDAEPADDADRRADDAQHAKIAKDSADVKENENISEEREDIDKGDSEEELTPDIDKEKERQSDNEEPATPAAENGPADDDNDDDENNSAEIALAASPPPPSPPDESAGERSRSSDGSPRPSDGSPRPSEGSPRPSDGSPRPSDGSPRPATDDKTDDALEKMTESISETEDERSYTPCLDENKSKDTSLETDKDKGIEGLDTEMISEDEGNEMFSDEGRASPSPALAREPTPPREPTPAPPEDGEIPDKRDRDDSKKKKKKESKREAKKEAKEKSKGKTKKADVNFKKLSKSGKERNYRDKDRERRDSSDTAAEKKRKRKEKRKDLERYDVRTLVSEKRRKPKDAFGRDVSPRRDPSAAASPPPRASLSPRARLSVSPRHGSPALRRRSPSLRRQSPIVRRRSPSLRRRSPSPRRRSPSLRRRSPSPRRRSPSPVIRRRSPSPVLRRRTPSLRRRSPSPRRRSNSPPLVRRRSTSSPARVRLSLSPARSPSPRRRRRSQGRRRRSAERPRKRRRSIEHSPSPLPKSKTGKRRRRARSERPVERRAEPRRKSPKRRRRRRSAVMSPVAAAWSPASVDSRLLSPRTPPPALPAPPAPPPPVDRTPKKRRRDERRHKRARSNQGPSKEVFTSGDNILVSVSFKDDERTWCAPELASAAARVGAGPGGGGAGPRRKKGRRRRPPAPDVAPRPVAIIDLERSPFRELTPSPTNVIVLSDTEQGPTEAPAPTAGASPAAGARSPAAGAPATGPRTPPARSPAAAAPPQPSPTKSGVEDARGPNTPPEPPLSPDAYDPFEPTRSPSPAHSPPSPAPAPPSPPRPSMTLETAQKTNLSADDVIDRRPLSPMEKVMALLQSTRDVSPEPPPSAPAGGGAGTGGGVSPAGPGIAPPPAHAHAHAHALGAPPPAPAPPAAPAAPPTAAAAPRIVLPEAVRAQPPKLFLAKPSPIKSDPIKPLQSSAVPIPRADSPYSPGSSDFGELFSPPGGGAGGGGGGGARGAGRGARDPFDAIIGRHRRHHHHQPAKVPVKLNKKKGKTTVGVKIDDDSLRILDELPSSAVEMQVKSKFLKKLNRQERVVEEVKLVLKPHYNKKRVTKEEYKDILRRAVPKICHNKSGEINPSKIQALVEAYVKKFRKKHKLGLA